MATIVPRTPGPEVAVQALPTFRETATADLSGNIQAGQALMQIGRQGVDLAQRMQQRNDTTAVMAARKELSDWEAQTFDPENPDGISKYKGQNALKANDELLPSLDQRMGEIRGRMSPRQQAQFDAVADNFRSSLQGRLNGYMDREHSVYLSAEQKAAIDNLGTDAAAAGAAGDFARQDSIATEVLAMNRARRQAEGMGEELIKAEERGMVSSIRAQTIDGMLVNRPFEAQAYFERYRDQMTPDDAAKAERALFPIVSDAESESLADAILSGTDPQAPVGGGDVDSMIVSLEGSAKNPNSSAVGVGQFLDSTWLQTVKAHRPDLVKGKSNEEILQLRSDAALGKKMVAAYRQDNARALTARGIPATATNLYAAHHFGPGGAARFASLPDSAPMSKVLSASEIAANPYLKGKSVGEVKANWAKRGLKEGGDAAASVSAPPASEADAIERARQIRDPRQRSAVVSKIRERYQIKEMREREAEKSLSEYTYKSIEQASDPTAPLRDLIGPAAYAQAEAKGQIPALENLRKHKIAGTFTQDDPTLVETLNREAVLSPNTFAKRNIYAEAGRLSTDTLSSLLEMQKKASDPAKRADWASTNQRIDSSLRVLGLDESKDPAGKAEKAERAQQRAAFGLVYREAERAFVQKNGKNPTPEQADVLMRTVTRQVAEDIPGKLSRAGAVEGFGAALPATDRGEIVRDFRADVGRDPTEAEIVMIAARYRMAQGQ